MPPPPSLWWLSSQSLLHLPLLLSAPTKSWLLYFPEPALVLIAEILQAPALQKLVLLLLLALFQDLLSRLQLWAHHAATWRLLRSCRALKVRTSPATTTTWEKKNTERRFYFWNINSTLQTSDLTVVFRFWLFIYLQPASFFLLLLLLLLLHLSQILHPRLCIFSSTPHNWPVVKVRRQRENMGTNDSNSELHDYTNVFQWKDTSSSCSSCCWWPDHRLFWSSSYGLLFRYLSQSAFSYGPLKNKETHNCDMKQPNLKQVGKKERETTLEQMSDIHHFIIFLCRLKWSPSSPIRSRTAEDACSSNALASPLRLNLTAHRTWVRSQTHTLNISSLLSQRCA